MGGLTLPANYADLKVTSSDLVIASLAWGFTMGFGFLTVWTAIKQSRAAWRRKGSLALRSPYLFMIWGEIFASLAFGILTFVYLLGVFHASFAFYFCILTLWVIQVQFLLQIIINRISVLLISRRRAMWLKISVAVIITLINISVYCIWIPARMQISEKYIQMNVYWDRIEKCIYLVVDAALNFYFIRIVKKQLLGMGLNKYKGLVTFNVWIIGFSLGMDVLIISMMSLHNSFVYMQFHPLAYIVKLNIEMSMADLIAKLSRNQNADDPDMGQSGNTGTHTGTGQGTNTGTFTDNQNKWKSGKIPSEAGQDLNPVRERKNSDGDSTDDYELDTMPRKDVDMGFRVHKQEEVKITTESLDLSENEYQADRNSGKGDSDERPLRDLGHLGSIDKHGKKGLTNIGSSTKVWTAQ